VVLVSGFVLFSSFVSSITSAMTQLRQMQDDRSQQMWLLRRFLTQRQINSELSFRVLRYIEYAVNEQRSLVMEHRIHVLSHLSEQLRAELQYAVSFNALKSHQFFAKLDMVSNMTMQTLASSALKKKELAKGDVLFVAGTQAMRMYMVVSGELLFLKATDAFDDRSAHTLLEKDDWLSEASLWASHWTHLGQAWARTDCKIMEIDVAKCLEVIQNDLSAWAFTARYANHFVDWLGKQKFRNLTDAFLKISMEPIIQELLDKEDDLLDEEEARRENREPSTASRASRASRGQTKFGSRLERFQSRSSSASSSAATLMAPSRSARSVA